MEKVERNGKMVWPCCGKEWCSVINGWAAEDDLNILRILPVLFVGAAAVTTLSIFLGVIK